MGSLKLPRGDLLKCSREESIVSDIFLRFLSSTLLPARPCMAFPHTTWIGLSCSSKQQQNKNTSKTRSNISKAVAPTWRSFSVILSAVRTRYDPLNGQLVSFGHIITRKGSR